MYTITFDFQDEAGPRDVSEFIDIKSRVEAAASEDFMSAQNTCDLWVKYDPDLFPLIKRADMDILVTITKDEEPWFRGFVPPTMSWSTDGIASDISMEVIGFSEWLRRDIPATGIVIENTPICDPADPENSLFHILAGACMDASFISPTVPSVPYVLQCLSVDEGQYYDILDALLHEYGYVLDENPDGTLTCRLWAISGPAAAFTADDSTIMVDGNKYEKLDNQFDAVEVDWYELKERLNTLVYMADLPFGDDHQRSGYSVPAGFAWPVEWNDPSLTEPVYQDFTDDGLVNVVPSILEGSGYKAVKIKDYSAIVRARNHYIDDRAVGLTRTATFFPKRASVKYQNDTDTDILIYWFDIYADVLYRSAQRNTKRTPDGGGKKFLVYESKFVFESAQAAALAEALFAYVSAGAWRYTFKSETNYPSFAILNAVDTMTGDSQLCFVFKRTTDPNTEIIEYELRGITELHGAPADSNKLPSAPPTTPANQAIDTDGNLTSAIIGNKLPEGATPAESGLYFQKDAFGYWDSTTASWKTVIRNDGSARFDGEIKARSGDIGGWLIGIAGSKLQSAEDGLARIELNPEDARISVINGLDAPKVAMGYLSGLAKRDGSGYWTPADYGFWAAAGDKLRIDGDAEYISGNWEISNDASFVIYSGLSPIIRLGTYVGDKGLFIREGATGSDYRARVTTTEFFVGNDDAFIHFADGNLDLQLSTFSVVSSMTTVLGQLQISASGTVDDLIDPLTLTTGSIGVIGAGYHHASAHAFAVGDHVVAEILSEETSYINELRIAPYIGSPRGGRDSYLCLEGDDTYTGASAGLVLMRLGYLGGTNAPSTIQHHGTGDLQVVSPEAADFVIRLGAVEYLRIGKTADFAVMHQDLEYLRLAMSDVALKIGGGIAGSHYSRLDLIGDATYTDYGFRIERGNTGAGAPTVLHHRGSGGIGIRFEDGLGDLGFSIYDPTASSTHLKIALDGTTLRMSLSDSVTRGVIIGFGGSPTTPAASLGRASGSSGTFTLENGSGDITINADGASGSDIFLNTQGTERFRISNNGDIRMANVRASGATGVLTTAAPHALHVQWNGTDYWIPLYQVAGSPTYTGGTFIIKAT